MIRIALFFALLVYACTPGREGGAEKMVEAAINDERKLEWGMVIHGGAGTILKANMTDEREAAYRNALDSALSIGEELLRSGADALDVVEHTIQYLEDNPLFNAGRGAVFTHDGTNELDASIMDGRDLNAGAVTGLTTVRHPISAARAVMEKSEHVMLAGAGAEKFCDQMELERVDPSFFYTERRYQSLQRALERTDKHGTVGAVVLDSKGNLAAGTSTGGMTNKKWDRIGDSPIIGAGTYANNSTCAISCTGHGEYFIRYAVAHAVSAGMEYGNMTLQEAADEIIHSKLNPDAGSGGLIGIDKGGNITMTFNTAGMYRGFITPDRKEVYIYKD